MTTPPRADEPGTPPRSGPGGGLESDRAGEAPVVGRAARAAMRRLRHGLRGYQRSINRGLIRNNAAGKRANSVAGRYQIDINIILLIFDYLTSTPNADPAGTGSWLPTPGRPSRLPASRIAAVIGVVPRASRSRGTSRLPTASGTGRPPDRRSPSGSSEGTGSPASSSRSGGARPGGRRGAGRTANPPRPAG